MKKVRELRVLELDGENEAKSAHGTLIKPERQLCRFRERSFLVFLTSLV
jgi:hypothetical protein